MPCPLSSTSIAPSQTLRSLTSLPKPSPPNPSAPSSPPMIPSSSLLPSSRSSTSSTASPLWPPASAVFGFEHIYFGFLAVRIKSSTSATFLYSVGKDMDVAIQKMEHSVAFTATLYAELEVLSDFEHSPRSFRTRTRPVGCSNKRFSGRGTTGRWRDERESLREMA